MIFKPRLAFESQTQRYIIHVVVDLYVDLEIPLLLPVADVSFDCSFRTMCGYKFISTSALLSWSLIYTKTAFLDSDENKGYY